MRPGTWNWLKEYTTCGTILVDGAVSNGHALAWDGLGIDMQGRAPSTRPERDIDNTRKGEKIDEMQNQ